MDQARFDFMALSSCVGHLAPRVCSTDKMTYMRAHKRQLRSRLIHGAASFRYTEFTSIGSDEHFYSAVPLQCADQPYIRGLPTKQIEIARDILPKAKRLGLMTDL
jgi:hypothetical protein